MNRKISTREVTRIHNLKAKGWNISQIASETGSTHKTVKKYLNGATRKIPATVRTGTVNGISDFLCKPITDPTTTMEYWKSRCERAERYILETTLQARGY